MEVPLTSERILKRSGDGLQAIATSRPLASRRIGMTSWARAMASGMRARASGSGFCLSQVGDSHAEELSSGLHEFPFGDDSLGHQNIAKVRVAVRGNGERLIDLVDCRQVPLNEDLLESEVHLRVRPV